MPTSPQANPFPWRFTAPLLLATTLNPINTSMLATGLVPIAADFEVSPGTAAILVSILYLFSAVTQPTIGKLGAVFGPRRVFLAGIALVITGGVVGMLAPSFGWLLASRALLGIGTSAAFPTSMSLVRRRADDAGIEAPTRVIGAFSIAAQVTVVLGLPLGGALVSLFGWRALFAVNVPVAGLALIAVALWVQRDAPIPRQGARATLRALDIPGILLFSATTVSLLLFFDAIATPMWWLLAAFAILATALILWERRASSPLIAVRVIAARPPLARTYVRQLLGGLTSYTALYGLSQWLQGAAGQDAGTVGLLMVPLSVASILVARLVSTRGWIRPSLLTGSIAVIVAGASFWLLDSSASALVPVLLIVTVLLGIAQGSMNVSIQSTMYLQVPASDIGAASGLLRTFMYVGAIFSSSLITLTYGDAVTDAGLHIQGAIVAVIGVALALLSLDRAVPVIAPGADRRSRTKEEHE